MPGSSRTNSASWCSIYSSCLHDYRGLRRVVRNVYAFTLRPSRLRELVSGLRPCFDSAARDLPGFAAFLERLALSGE